MKTLWGKPELAWMQVWVDSEKDLVQVASCTSMHIHDAQLHVDKVTIEETSVGLAQACSNYISNQRCNTQPQACTCMSHADTDCCTM